MRGKQLDGESGDPGIRIGFDVGRVAQRLQQADQHRAALQVSQLVAPRLVAEQRALHLQQDIGTVECRRCIRGDRGTRRGEGVVGEGGLAAGAALCGDFEPHLDHALDRSPETPPPGARRPASP